MCNAISTLTENINWRRDRCALQERSLLAFTPKREIIQPPTDFDESIVRKEPTVLDHSRVKKH